MRLNPEIKNYIINAAAKYFPGTELYLFGSRVNDNAKGGDIDLLLLSDKKIPLDDLRKFRVNFYKKFGWQKIDLVNYTFVEENTFKKIALDNAILINHERSIN